MLRSLFKTKQDVHFSSQLKPTETEAQVATWAMYGLTHGLVILKHLGAGAWNPYREYLCVMADFTCRFYLSFIFPLLLPRPAGLTLAAFSLSSVF